MRVTRAAEEKEQRAAYELAAIPKLMKAEAELGAVEELQSKTYVDRTKNARNSTQGRLERSSPAEAVAILEVDVEYASYLRRRGFSKIDQVARETKVGITDQFEAMAERITKD